MTHDLLIGGHLEPGQGPAITIIDPASGEVAAEVAAASLDQVDRAITVAAEAFPAWRTLPQSDRSAALRGIAADLEREREDIARLLSLDTGRPFQRNLIYVDFTVGIFRQYAELSRVLGGRIAPSNDPGQLSMVLRVPYGVVSCLIPWNYPLTLLAFKVAPALAVGNTVVIKGARETTLSTLRLNEIFRRNTPPGVVNGVAGVRPVGERLVEHPLVDLVAFTGSTGAGQSIGATCARLNKPTHLELGGKDPAIVFDDVDPRLAAQGVVWAAFLNAGQVCTSTERAYVHRSVYDRFVENAVELASGLRVGHPLDEKTQIGPMRTERGRATVQRHLGDAVSAGAEILAGGETPPGGGFYFPPTVVVDVDHSMELLQEETFGPVLPIMPFDSVDEAFELAADTPYGLGASLYTRDPGIVRRGYEELRVGNLWINDPVVDNQAAPFGGSRASGNARELGLEGLYGFTDIKHVHWNMDLQEKSWWYPYEE
jgi:betaine-aldehyde dehydrogenase